MLFFPLSQMTIKTVDLEAFDPLDQILFFLTTPYLQYEVNILLWVTLTIRTNICGKLISNNLIEKEMFLFT